MVVEVSRRERKKELTRQALLCAASKLFAGKGYDQTTIDDIVNQADVAKVTFYYYFKSKEELVLAIKTSITDQTVDIAEALLSASTSAETVVRALALEMALWVENHRPLFEVFFQQRFSPLMAAKHVEHLDTSTAGNTNATGNTGGAGNTSATGNTNATRNISASDATTALGPPPRLLNLVEKIVIKGQETGEFRSDFNSRELGHFILSNLMHEQFMWMSIDQNETLAKRMDRRIDLMLGGLTPTPAST
jgi:AcrR family transcriptional regulator